MNEAVAKLMATVEFRHNVTLDEFVLTDIICDSIPADMHWTELPEYTAGEIYQMCYQELLEHLQWYLRARGLTSVSLRDMMAVGISEPQCF